MKVMRFAAVLGNTGMSKEEFYLHFKEALDKLDLALKRDSDKNGTYNVCL